MINTDNLYKKIDEDKGLKSKKNILNITSLILLAIQFTGAEIIEANTFILKLSFKHQNGIALLLMLSIIFLLIRYYNYAKPYHNDLYSIWSNNLLNDYKINYICPHSDEASGLLHENYPKGFSIHDPIYQNHPTQFGYKYFYQCKWIFFRYFRFRWDNEHETLSDKVNILKSVGLKKYLSILGMEFKYQFSRYFTHRENLDILAPYFLGLLALSSSIFTEKFNLILKYLLDNVLQF